MSGGICVFVCLIIADIHIRAPTKTLAIDPSVAPILTPNSPTRT